MKKKQKNFAAKVLFDASVILSAFRSPNGGSGKLLRLLQKKQYIGVISETILDEALKHADRIPQTREELRKKIHHYFPTVESAPSKTTLKKWNSLMLDYGDTHLFATCEDIKAAYLVSLDKHHILILQGKIPNVSILSPGQLLAELKKKKLML